MKPDPESSQQDGELVSLRIRVAELERKLREERDNFELLQAEAGHAKLIALQETEKYERKLLSLSEQVERLEEDCRTLREREVRDRERIKELQEGIEKRDREINEKIVEFKVESRDLECAKRRAEDDGRVWMNKCGDLLFQESKLVDEILRLKEREKETTRNAKGNGMHYGDDDVVVIDDEDEDEDDGSGIMQGANANNVIHIDGDHEQVAKRTELRSCEEELLLTPEPPTRKRVLVCGSDDEAEVEGGHHHPASAAGYSVHEEDSMTLCQMREKRLTSSMPPLSQASNAGNYGQKRSAKVAGIRSASSKARKVTDTRIRSYCTRYPQNQSSSRPYTGRIASSEQKLAALRRAETLQRNLKSWHPSFIKTMVPSHVSGGFWFGLPMQFCIANIPSLRTTMILEDEEGAEYGVICIGEKAGLSGGWRGFALAHNLELGDALVFELTEPTRFKVYILKAILDSSEDLIHNLDEGTLIHMQDVDLSTPLYSSKETSNVRSSL